MPKQKTIKNKNAKPIEKNNEKSKKTRARKILQKDNFTQSIPERLKLDESYRSLVLGALVVILLIVFLMAVVSSKKAVDEIQTKLSPTPSLTVTPAHEQTYILKDGEGIWDVALKFYGDGYRWTEIANANNLDEYSANFLTPGTKLIIPQK